MYRELASLREQLPRALEIAMRPALGRGGVAVVVIPGKIFLQHTGSDASSPGL